jgi:hypothetical protein
MRGGTGSLYAGWVIVDVRLVFFVLGLALLLSIGVLALFVKGRRWYDYVSVGFGIYVFFVTALVLGFNWALRYPVFKIEAFFPFP